MFFPPRVQVSVKVGKGDWWGQGAVSQGMSCPKSAPKSLGFQGPQSARSDQLCPH